MDRSHIKYEVFSESFINKNWFDIPEYENLYQINKITQNVRNNKTKKIISVHFHTHGYLQLSLRKNKKGKKQKLHRLMGLTFLSNPNNYKCINHIDGNKLNNRIINLEFCSYAYNNKHARKLGLNESRHYGNRSIVQLDLNNNFLNKFKSIRNATTQLNFNNHQNIQYACKGISKTAYGYKWMYLEDYEELIKDK